MFIKYIIGYDKKLKIRYKKLKTNDTWTVAPHHTPQQSWQSSTERSTPEGPLYENLKADKRGPISANLESLIVGKESARSYILPSIIPTLQPGSQDLIDQKFSSNLTATAWLYPRSVTERWVPIPTIFTTLCAVVFKLSCLMPLSFYQKGNKCWPSSILFLSIHPKVLFHHYNILK